MNSTVISKSTSHFVKCSCSSEMLEIRIYDYGDGDSGVEFASWSRGRDGNKICGIREKLRWCWNILKTGSPWADDIIATNKDARGLAEFILKNLPEDTIDQCPVCNKLDGNSACGYCNP